MFVSRTIRNAVIGAVLPSACFVLAEVAWANVCPPHDADPDFFKIQVADTPTWHGGPTLLSDEVVAYYRDDSACNIAEDLLRKSPRLRKDLVVMASAKVRKAEALWDQRHKRRVILYGPDYWKSQWNRAPNAPYILYFIMAHEIGHLLLDHVGPLYQEYMTDEVRVAEELDADEFAGRLLARMAPKLDIVTAQNNIEDAISDSQSPGAPRKSQRLISFKKGFKSERSPRPIKPAIFQKEQTKRIFVQVYVRVPNSLDESHRSRLGRLQEIIHRMTGIMLEANFKLFALVFETKNILASDQTDKNGPQLSTDKKLNRLLTTNRKAQTEYKQGGMSYFLNIDLLGAPSGQWNIVWSVREKAETPDQTVQVEPFNILFNENIKVPKDRIKNIVDKIGLFIEHRYPKLITLKTILASCINNYENMTKKFRMTFQNNYASALNAHPGMKSKYKTISLRTRDINTCVNTGRVNEGIYKEYFRKNTKIIYIIQGQFWTSEMVDYYDFLYDIESFGLNPIGQLKNLGYPSTHSGFQHPIGKRNVMPIWLAKHIACVWEHALAAMKGRSPTRPEGYCKDTLLPENSAE